MEIIALVLAALALFVALAARARIGLLDDRLRSLEAAGSRSAPDLTYEVELNRRFIARLSAGEELDPESVREGRSWGDVTPERALELFEGGCTVLDVRTPSETNAGVIPGAILIPVDELPQRYGELKRDAAPLLIYCAMGVRSAAACEFLSEQGFESLHNLGNGFGSWGGERSRPTASSPR